MPAFVVKSIEPAITDQVRHTQRSPQFGHPSHTELAAGYGPCRSCLNVFHIGEERRILFTYDPFAGLDAYPSPGPVFIHENDCLPYGQSSVFPPALRDLPLTLEGYGAGRWLLARERPTNSDIEPAIDRILTNPDVEYIHVRNTEAGCYIASIERSITARRHLR